MSEISPPVEVRLDDAAADDLELLLTGAYPVPARYHGAAEREHIRREGRLLDGTPWELPLALELRRGRGVVEPGSRLTLVDRERVPLATLDVEEVTPGGDPAPDGGPALAAGPLSPAAARTAPVFARRRAVPQAWSERVVLAVPTAVPLLAPDAAAIDAIVAGREIDVVLLALTGTGHPLPTDTLVRSLLALPGRHDVRTLPLPAHPELDAAAWQRVLVRVAAAHGASEVALLPGQRDGGGEPGQAPDAGADLPVVVHRPWGTSGWDLLRESLGAGQDVDATLVSPDVVAEVRRVVRPPRERGVVVFFTGLSGSGKSTVARAVTSALLERTHRSVTLLDGDEVRTHLSSGLTFSRADRETNVARIGYVAAEVAAHGGTAVCAPIAPYASTRAEVRRRVEARHGAFVLVHVATPLHVCEARDRKGLYAKARAGLVPEFTGISDPYEEPTDPDIVLDTTELDVEACAELVLATLRERRLIDE